MKNSRNGYKFNIKDNEELTNYLLEHTTNASQSCVLIWFINENGDTILWTGEVKEPYSLRYQINEEPDQCNLVLLSFLNDKKVFSKKIKNLTKVIVMNNATLSDHIPTFDNDGKPLNHDQYVIVSGTCSLRNGNEYYYEHEYSLAEPIYTLRYWATETQTITNMTSITLSEYKNSQWSQNTYTQKATNLYYVLKRMLEITGYKTSSEDCSLDTLIEIKDMNLLKASCKGINDNFMASNFYQNLMKMAKYLDRLPALYFNPNYEIQDTNNIDENKKEYLLFFERKITEKLYTEEEVFTDISGYCECELATKDAGTVVVDAQNVISSSTVIYPGYNSYCAATGEKGKTLLSETDYLSIKLPTAIEQILSVEVYFIKKYNIGEKEFYYQGDTMIAPCLEYQEWINISNINERKKYIYYKRNENVVEIDHSIYCHKNKEYWQPSGTSNLKMEFFYSIKYLPAFNSRIKISHSNAFECSITQVDSKLDSKNYGNYLKTYAKENNNIDYSLSKTYFEFNKILLPGDCIELNNGKRLIVASTDITRKNNSYFVIYVFNEYFVKRSSFISASSKIDNKLINKESSMIRMVNIKEKMIKVSFNLAQSNRRLNFNYINDNQLVTNGYLGKNKVLVSYPNVAYFKFDYENIESKYFLLNINKSQVGKSIIYNITAEDSTIIYGGGYSGENSNNTYVKYTDAFGKIKKMSMYFTVANTNIFKLFIKEKNDGSYENTYSQTKENIKNHINKQPLISNTEFNSQKEYSAIKVDDLIILKDTNEILNLSFQVDFQTGDNDSIIFDKFVEINNLIYNGNAVGSSENDYKFFAMIVIDKNYKITEEVEDLNDLIHLNYIYVKMISPEAVSDNCIKINEGDLNQRIPKGSQIVLLQIISRSSDEEIIKDYEFVGTPKNIYPLFAHTIRTDYYDSYNTEKLFYIEFYN